VAVPSGFLHSFFGQLDDAQALGCAGANHLSQASQILRLTECRFMDDNLLAGLTALLKWLALPEVGLPALFLVAFVSATLLPMGSEPALLALIKLQPELFWPAVLVATLGNTLGGGVSWWMGHAAQRATSRLRHRGQDPDEAADGWQAGGRHDARRHAMAWLQRYGAVACLLSWLPVVGDPLCAVAGWLRLPFWPCLAYMAIGKFARYLVLTSLLLAWLP
jgi:membrane protein YqaA with SNARE-associated domain